MNMDSEQLLVGFSMNVFEIEAASRSDLIPCHYEYCLICANSIQNDRIESGFKVLINYCSFWHSVYVSLRAL